MFEWHLLWHTTVRAKGVAELSSLKRYNRSKRGLLHRVEHYVGHTAVSQWQLSLNGRRLGIRIRSRAVLWESWFLAFFSVKVGQSIGNSVSMWHNSG